jgi:hypothetical protein
MAVGRIGRDDTECEGAEGEENECLLTVVINNSDTILVAK